MKDSRQPDAMTSRDQPEAAPESAGKKGGVLAFVKELALIVLFMLSFHTLAYGAYHIPSSSMRPTLEIGDRIWVSKFSYGYNSLSLPFSPDFLKDRRLFGDRPRRGDVAVFIAPSEDNEVLIKRVIGMPGDHVRMKNGRLYINGREVPRRLIGESPDHDDWGRPVAAKVYEETLPGGVTHMIREFSDTAALDNTREFVVPPDHYFMMGDNRDNSADSRVTPYGIGAVPYADFIGRAERLSWSIADCDTHPDSFCLFGLPLGRFGTALSD